MPADALLQAVGAPVIPSSISTPAPAHPFAEEAPDRSDVLCRREGHKRIIARHDLGLDGDVLDADVLPMVLVGDDDCHAELHAVQVELAAARPGIFRSTVTSKLSM